MRTQEIYQEAGLTLAGIQFADKCFVSVLTYAFPDGGSHTLDGLQRDQRNLKKATLGPLIQTLSKRVELDPDFETVLQIYLSDRNSFIHEWERIEHWENDLDAKNFMIGLQKRSMWLVCVFVEIIRQWAVENNIAPDAMERAKAAGIFDVIDGPWLDHLELMFTRVK